MLVAFQAGFSMCCFTDNVGVHLLSVSDCGQYVATGDHSSNVHVYDLHNLKVSLVYPTHYH